MSSPSTTAAASAPPASVYALGSRWQREWLAASCGCTIADTIFNPLDIIKVRSLPCPLGCELTSSQATARIASYNRL